jgi:hypothetical protein
MTTSEGKRMKNETYQGNKKILFLTTFAFFLTFVVWFNMAPFGKTIMKALNLSKEEMGITVLSFVSPSLFFRVIGIVAIACSAAALFLKEPFLQKTEAVLNEREMPAGSAARGFDRI